MYILYAGSNPIQCFFKESLFQISLKKYHLGHSRRSPTVQIDKAFLLEGEVSFSGEKLSILLPVNLVASVHLSIC